MVSGSRVNDNSAMIQHPGAVLTNMDIIQQAIDRQFPIRDGMCLLAGEIDDHLDELYDIEREQIAKAVEKRRREFATGRILARRAMREVGLNPGPIRRGDQRQPLWPEGCLGSITHADRLAVAGVAASGSVRGLGLDVEVADRVGENLHDKLFTAWELSQLAGADPRLPGLLFSAKEAGYKATFPIAGKFIGFQEAEVLVDWPGNRFRFRYVGEHGPNRVMEEGEGYFLFCERYVLSLVIIPRES
jgi:4'-phosphopantetheinyl transferase EntD